jgi:hypothetical protein
MAIVKYESAEEINMENLMTGAEDPEMMNRIYNNENYKKAVKLWFPFLDKKGFMDKLIKKEGINGKKEE